MEDSVWVKKDLAVSHPMLVWRCSRLLESFFADRPDTRMAYLSMGTWVNHEQHVISRLLLKFNIVSTLSMLVETLHFNHAVQGSPSFSAWPALVIFALYSKKAQSSLLKCSTLGG